MDRHGQSVSQSGSPKLFPKAKLLPKILLQNDFPKYLCKMNVPKRLYFKSIPQNNSPKLFSKAAPENCCPKVVAKSCSPKLRSKANPQNCGSLKLLFKGAKLLLLPKAVQWLSQSCYALNVFPKMVPPPKRLPKVAPQSCCRKLPPKIAF